MARNWRKQTDRETIRVATIELQHADTPGGILAWQNPAGADIIVTSVLVQISADAPDLTFALDFGVATNGVTSSNTLAAGYSSARGALPYMDSGLLFSPAFILPASKWLTVSKNAGSAAGLAGVAYIFWCYAQN